MDQNSFGLLFVAAAIVGLIIAVLLVQVPIYIAKSRGITGQNLTIIKLLSWVGILVGVTWLVALVLALIWQPKPQEQQLVIQPEKTDPTFSTDPAEFASETEKKETTA